MPVTIRKLTPEICEDFLRFFDHDAFADHEEWAGCYCLEGHLSKIEDEKITDPAVRRAIAKEMVLFGNLQGYLAYDGDRVIGWCSAGEKRNYRKLFESPEFCTVSQEETAPGEIFAIYCFDIAPARRGKGIARQMLEFAIADAKAQGYRLAEAYPFIDPSYEYSYHGKEGMFAQSGFTLYEKRKWITILRKTL